MLVRNKDLCWVGSDGVTMVNFWTFTLRYWRGDGGGAMVPTMGWSGATHKKKLGEDGELIYIHFVLFYTNKNHVT